MSSKFSSVADKIANIGGRIASITYLVVIKNAFASILPLIITGSFATLLNNVLASTKNGLAHFEPFRSLENLSGIFNPISYACMNLLAFYLVMQIARNLAAFRGDSKNISSLLALVCYIILVPTSIPIDAETTLYGITTAYSSSQGLFMAIIVGIVSTELFSRLLKIEKLKIKMPEAVPTGVAESFSVLVPIIIQTLIFGVFGWLFFLITNSSVPDAIYTVLQIPLSAIMQHPAGVIVLAIIAQMFWLVGIHGTQVISVVRNSVGLAAIAENLTAFENGLEMPNVFTYTFWNTYITLGGAGNTIGLLVAIFFFSKREDYRAIGKLSLIPSLFGINEPLIFGLPIVLNPYLAIPFVLAPVLTATIGYVSTAIGFASPAMITVPFTLPPLINGYMSTAGSFGTVLTQLLCIIVSILVYIPFVKIANISQSKDSD